MRIFEAATADRVWSMGATAFSNGEARPQESRAGRTLELLHVAFVIRDSRERWVFSRQPAMNPAFALAEVIWIVNGHRDSAFPNFWNPRLPQYAGGGPTYHGAYGHRLRRHFGIDQLDRAARALQANSDTRQVVLQVWDSASDLPDQTGRPSDPDVPCNVVSMLKVRSGKLEWMQIIRSNDLFLGVPHNFVQFTTLQEIMAGWIGVEPGTYTQVSDSLHMYEKDTQSLMSPVEVTAAPNTDVISYPRDISESGLRELDQRARRMTQSDVARGDLERTVADFAGAEGFQNWLRVLGADAARRRGWDDEASNLMEACTNPSLRLLWRRWSERMVASELARGRGSRIQK